MPVQSIISRSAIACLFVLLGLTSQDVSGVALKSSATGVSGASNALPSDLSSLFANGKSPSPAALEAFVKSQKPNASVTGKLTTKTSGKASSTGVANASVTGKLTTKTSGKASSTGVAQASKTAGATSKKTPGAKVSSSAVASSTGVSGAKSKKGTSPSASTAVHSSTEAASGTKGVKATPKTAPKSVTTATTSTSPKVLPASLAAFLKAHNLPTLNATLANNATSNATRLNATSHNATHTTNHTASATSSPLKVPKLSAPLKTKSPKVVDLKNGNGFIHSSTGVSKVSAHHSSTGVNVKAAKLAHHSSTGAAKTTKITHSIGASSVPVTVLPIGTGVAKPKMTRTNAKIPTKP